MLPNSNQFFAHGTSHELDSRYDRAGRTAEKIDAVPAISWATGLKEPEGEWQEISGPCLGVFDRPQLPADAIQNLDGIELVFNVPAEQVLLFEDRVIDFSEERGIHFAD